MKNKLILIGLVAFLLIPRVHAFSPADEIRITILQLQIKLIQAQIEEIMRQLKEIKPVEQPVAIPQASPIPTPMNQQPIPVLTAPPVIVAPSPLPEPDIQVPVKTKTFKLPIVVPEEPCEAKICA